MRSNPGASFVQAIDVTWYSGFLQNPARSTTGRSTRHIEQTLRCLEIRGLESLREPAIDCSKHALPLSPTILLGPQLHEAHRCPQFPCQRALTAGAFYRSYEIVLGLGQ